jgi:hypothetical protein
VAAEASRARVANVDGESGSGACRSERADVRAAAWCAFAAAVSAVAGEPEPTGRADLATTGRASAFDVSASDSRFAAAGTRAAGRRAARATARDGSCACTFRAVACKPCVEGTRVCRAIARDASAARIDTYDHSRSAACNDSRTPACCGTGCSTPNGGAWPAGTARGPVARTRAVPGGARQHPLLAGPEARDHRRPHRRSGRRCARRARRRHHANGGDFA